MFRPHLAKALGLVALFSVLTATAAADDPAPNIYAAAKAAVADGRTEKTEILGANSKHPFTEISYRGGLFSGLDCGVGPDGDIEIVWAIRPIFRTAKGDLAPLPERGLFLDRTLFVEGKAKVVKSRVKRTVNLRAPAGYAVGGLTVRSGLNINGLCLIYYPINGDHLDVSRPRNSEWVGDRTGGGERTISGKGQPVVGVFGSTDEIHVRGLGLVLMKGGVPLVVKPPTTEKAIEKPPTSPAKGEPPVERPATVPQKVETPSSSPETGPSSKATETAVSTAGPDWMTFAIFGGVAVAVALPVFLVLRNTTARRELPPPKPRVPPDPARAAPGRPALSSPAPSANDEPILDVLPATVTPSSAAISATPTSTKPAWQPPPKEMDEDRPPPPAAEKPDPLKGWREIKSPSPRESPEARTALSKAQKEVSGTLFGIAALQFICGIAVMAIAADKVAGQPVTKQAAGMMMGMVILIAFVFAGLGLWARFQPMPAAVIGTILYVGFLLLDFVANPALVMNGIIVKVCIIAALIRAISTASKANEFR